MPVAHSKYKDSQNGHTAQQRTLLDLGIKKQYFTFWTIDMVDIGNYLPFFYAELLWAPYVDKHGTRKQWLLATLLLQSIACGLTAFVPFANVPLLALMLFLQNTCTSVQDISVDSLAVAVLAVEDVGLGNVAQVVGYKFGGVMAGALYMLLYNTMGHGATYLVLMIVYLTALLFILNIDLDPTDNVVGKEKTTTHNSHWTTISEALGVQGTVWMLAYTLFYKCGENGSINMIPMFLLDNGISETKVAVCTGIMGAFTTILGSTCGGILLQRYSVYDASYWLNIARCSVISTIFLSLLMWRIFSHVNYILADLLLILCCTQLFLSGLSSILTFSWMMHLSQNAPQHLQTTHYTTLATSEILGKLLFSSTLGYITDSLGYTSMFTLLTLAVASIMSMTLSTPSSLRALGTKCQSSHRAEPF